MARWQRSFANLKRRWQLSGTDFENVCDEVTPVVVLDDASGGTLPAQRTRYITRGFQAAQAGAVTFYGIRAGSKAIFLEQFLLDGNQPVVGSLITSAITVQVETVYPATSISQIEGVPQPATAVCRAGRFLLANTPPFFEAVNVPDGPGRFRDESAFGFIYKVGIVLNPGEEFGIAGTLGGAIINLSHWMWQEFDAADVTVPATETF